jgi:hypothetical protein
MKARLLSVASLLCGSITGAIFVSSGAHAITVDLVTTAIGNVIDDAGDLADGIFDRVQATTNPQVAGTGNFIYRAVMEFSLGSIPAGSLINSARLHWELGSSANPPNDVQFHGYVGNGVLEIADGLHDNLLTTVSVPEAGIAGVYTFSINVTGFLAAQLAANDPYSGFMLRLPTEPSFPYEEKNYFIGPTLLVDFTPTPLPAALPLFATGLGALGLLDWRRKRKAI